MIPNLTHINIIGKLVINFSGTQESHISGEGFQRTSMSEHLHALILWKQAGIFWSYMPPVCIYIGIQVGWNLSMYAKQNP